jgi:hypothetical protein
MMALPGNSGWPDDEIVIVGDRLYVRDCEGKLFCLAPD